MNNQNKLPAIFSPTKTLYYTFIFKYKPLVNLLGAQKHSVSLTTFGEKQSFGK